MPLDYSDNFGGPDVTQGYSPTEQLWLSSVAQSRLGVTPLAAPASDLVFSLYEDSLGASYKFLRSGGVGSLADGSKLSTVAQQWNWLLSNLDEELGLGVGLGYVSHPRGNFRFPLFWGFLAADFTTPVGHLQLEGKLELNEALVKILQQKFGIDSRWLAQARKGSGLNLEALWKALRQALDSHPGAAKLVLEREIRVGLARRPQEALLADLRENLPHYRHRPLVEKYASQDQAVSWQQSPTTQNPLIEGLLAPLRADHQQLQVPRYFEQGTSFILSGAPATGKTTAVVNSLATAVAAGKSTLVVGKNSSLDKLRNRCQQIGMEHLFLTIRDGKKDRQAQKHLRDAVNHNFNADPDYLQSCRQSLASLSQDLDLYCHQVHEVGTHQVSAWMAFTAQLLTAAELSLAEQGLAQELLHSPNFPYLSADRAHAAKLGEELGQLDAHSVNGLGANPWSLLGTDLENFDREAVHTAVKTLETAISSAHPAVLEIMSACAKLSTWPVFSRWLGLLELGYGRAPVELTPPEHQLLVRRISTLRSGLKSLLEQSQPLMELAAEAYRHGLDLDLLADARHAQSSSGLSRNSRRKAILAQLRPYLSENITPQRAIEVVEELSALRGLSEKLGRQISANPVLGLPQFEPLAPGALSRFNLHADTILTAIQLASDLASRREDLESLMPIAREGGHLGDQVKSIAQAFAAVLDSLHTTQSQLEAWNDGLPPLGRYLQVRKVWLTALETSDSTLDDMVAYRALVPQLNALGLEALLAWVEAGKLQGKSIPAVLEHALSLAAVEERLRSSEQLSYSGAAHQSQAERLSATVTETRREIQNLVLAQAAQHSERRIHSGGTDFAASLQETDFSPAQALRDNLDAVLARTPILGLTPCQVAQFLSGANAASFDAVVILDSSDLAEGAVVKSLALAQQVLWVATTPASRSFSKSRNAYTAAVTAGFPEYKFRIRYGKSLSPTVNQLAGLDPQLLTWPAAPASSRPVQVITLPSPSRFSSWSPADEVPGWRGVGADREWFERSGNFLVNLCAKNRSTRVLAVAWTTELATGIRAYLEELCLTNPAVNLANLDLRHLGDARGLSQSDVVVFFIGATANPDVTAAGSRADFNAEFRKVALSANRLLVLVLNEDTEVGTLPRILRETMEPSAPPGVNTLDSQASTVCSYLAGLLSRAGLEVRVDLGQYPLHVDLAVRDSGNAPWLAIQLDTPQWCDLCDALDREVNAPQFLVSQCGYGALDHIFWADLATNPDEVTRRIVAIALDLAYPGEVLDGAVAEEDRYVLPASVTAAPTRAAVEVTLPDIFQAPPAPPQRLNPARSSTGKTPKPVAAPQTPPPAAPPRRRSHTPVPLQESQLSHVSSADIHTGIAPSLAQELAQNQAEWVREIAAPVLEPGRINPPGEGDFSPLLFPAPTPPKPAAGLPPTKTAPPVTNPGATLAPRTSTEERTSKWEETTTPTVLEPTTLALGSLTRVSTDENPPSPVENPGLNSVENPVTPRPKAGIALQPRGSVVEALGQKEQLDELDDSDNAAAVKAGMLRILAQEGPLGTERLAKLVAQAFGIQRLHPKRRDKVLALLPAQIVIETTDFGEFVWPENHSPQEYPFFRTGSVYGPRPITSIPDAEFNNALSWVIAQQQPSEEELSEKVAQALDLGTARTQMRQRLKVGLGRLDAAGLLTSKAGRYSLK